MLDKIWYKYVCRQKAAAYPGDLHRYIIPQIVSLCVAQKSVNDD